MRLIDAERLSAEIFKASMDEHFMPMKLLDCDTVTEIIGNAPTIEERKTGKWAVNEVGVVRCPFCHANMNPRKNRKPKYCDECGAKIEGEQK